VQVDRPGNGPRLNGVTVHAHNVIPVAKRSYSAVARGDGTFVIDGLPAGQYALCAHSAGGDFVDSCAWALAATRVTVQAGQQARGAVVSVPEGVRVTIRVLDNGNALTKRGDEDVLPPLVIEVREATTGISIHASVKTQTPGNLTYELLVPRGRTYTLKVTGPELVMTGSAGRAVAATGEENTFAVTANSQHQFTYTINSRVAGRSTGRICRLRSATNPESGLTEYQYHDDGALKLKIDGNGKRTEMEYDSLRRPVKNVPVVESEPGSEHRGGDVLL
jgi:hypothetical protein